MISTVYMQYKKFYSQSPVIKFHLQLSLATALLESAFIYLTDNYSIKLEKDNMYKLIMLNHNVGHDEYNIEKSLFAVGEENLYSRILMKEKFILNLNEQNYILSALNSLINFKLFQTIFTIYSAYKNSLFLREEHDNQIKDDSILVSNEFNSFLNYNAAEFNQFSINFYHQLVKTIELFNSNPDINLKNQHIKTILDAINNYKKNMLENDKIYYNGESNKLILSDLKISSVKDSKTIVDFAGGELSIDIKPGIHYLWEGENSIGKSLLLKMIIGSSGGLSASGKIFYPIGFTQKDISYVLQDDYYGIFKPLLHRLAAPKLLPADILTTGVDINNVMSEEEFDRFVDFIANLLFEMKYEKSWNNSSDAKESLLQGYESYKNTLAYGGEDDFFKLLSSYDKQSGGHKKKLALANAIYNKAKLILLDESFNAIDQDIKLTIYSLIDKYLPDSTVLAIQHQVANHLIEEKESKDSNKDLLESLKMIEAKSRLSENLEMHEINKLISDVLSNIEGVKISSEEMEFFQTIITMSRIEVASESTVKNIFNITNLSNESLSLAMFSEHEEYIRYAEISECKVISTYEEIAEFDMSSTCFL